MSRAGTRIGWGKAIALATVLALFASCRREGPREAPSWPRDCAPRARPDPLGLEAAREALRVAGRRHERRLREAAFPGSMLRDARRRLADIDRLCVADVAEIGEDLFEHEFGFVDGLGGGDAARRAGTPFRRVHEGLFGGPETISCPSCHWVGGPNGAGAETDNAYLSGDGDRPDSGDSRNPQALVGLGVVEALAREISRDLQRQRDELVREAAGAAKERRLSSKGVDFGVLRVGADGVLDASGLDGVDADLVVKPFGWKGTHATLTSFSTEALQVHLGVQTDALVAGGPGAAAGNGRDAADPDADGVRDEFPSRLLAAMTLHLALLELPIVEPLFQERALPAAASALLAPTATSFVDDFARGRAQFHSLGCANCHRPRMVLEDPVLVVEGLPPVDLAREMRTPGLVFDEAAGGYPVWAFSDFKRHDMGAANAAHHLQGGVASREYLTPRLWGLADSVPWLHDGRAPSLDYAIAGHDGEGAASRAAFEALPSEEKGALRVYLMSLRRASRVVVP
jgi:mono/diheme cytochrome c family protein